MSYSDLPYFLRSCFLYCGIFPEDCEIKANKLLQMWITEGFVQKGEEMVEDVAEDYLEELIHRSMIQVARRKWCGRVKSCRIHDLLRDLSFQKPKIQKNLRYTKTSSLHALLTIVDILLMTQKIFLKHLHTCRLLRSLICSIDLSQVNLISCLRTKLLTVLDLTLLEVRKDLQIFFCRECTFY